MDVVKKKERLEIIVEDIVYGGNGINKSDESNMRLPINTEKRPFLT